MGTENLILEVPLQHGLLVLKYFFNIIISRLYLLDSDKSAVLDKLARCRVQVEVSPVKIISGALAALNEGIAGGALEI